MADVPRCHFGHRSKSFANLHLMPPKQIPRGQDQRPPPLTEGGVSASPRVMTGAVPPWQLSPLKPPPNDSATLSRAVKSRF